jgi:tetratricopeptide (TPR) repeat protein
MTKTLCLNMIVKNEMANLERCLGSVADYIDCWVIGDTGSTDGTQEFVKSFFAERCIPGELHSFPFQNFEQARNAALDCSAASKLAYDYLMLADADMELVVEDKSFREMLEAPGYRLLQRAGLSFTYWNTRLVQKNLGARYHGVTHEYLDVPREVKELHGVWYKDHASGSNRPDKFGRDISLLKEALRTEKNKFLQARYIFYLGQSYQDAGENEKALPFLLKRAQLGHWTEEVFMSLYAAGKAQEAIGRPFEEVIATYARACDVAPTRAEALHAASRFCRINNKFADGYDYARRGVRIPLPIHGLFVESWIYEYGLLDELAENALQFERYQDCIDACDRLLREGRIPQQMHERVASCRQLASDKLMSRNQVAAQPKMIDFVPKPAADIVMEMIEGELLLYHPQQACAVYLSPTAAVIWGLCDGKRSTREIIQLIGDSYPVAAATVTDDVLITLNELQDSGVLVAR